jgi:hypothetical protein
MKRILGMLLIIAAIGKVVYDVYFVRGHTGDILGYFNAMIQTSNIQQIGMIGGGLILGLILLAMSSKEDVEHLSHR